MKLAVLGRSARLPDAPGADGVRRLPPLVGPPVDALWSALLDEIGGDAPVTHLRGDASAALAALTSPGRFVAVHTGEASAAQPRWPSPAEGGAALWLDAPEHEGPGPRIQWTVRSGDEPWPELLDAVLAEADLSPGELAGSLSASLHPDHVEAERAGLERVLGPLAPPLVQLAFRVGDLGAAVGLLAVQAALEENDAQLILATGQIGRVAIALAPAPF